MQMLRVMRLVTYIFNRNINDNTTEWVLFYPQVTGGGANRNV